MKQYKFLASVVKSQLSTRQVTVHTFILMHSDEPVKVNVVPVSGTKRVTYKWAQRKAVRRAVELTIQST